MSQQNKKNIAMFIDCDNVSAKYVKSILEDLSQYGTVNIRRAYGDWKDTKLIGWEKNLHTYNIKPIQQFAYTSGKNATDIAMIIDIMDTLFTKELEAIVLITSDSDFTPIVSRILSDGITVYGYGESKTPMPFVNACSQFIYVEKLSAFEEESSKNSTNDSTDDSPIRNYVGNNYNIRKDFKLINFLKRIVEQTSDEQGWADVKDVSKHIRQNYSFSHVNYGFKKMGELMKAVGVFEIEYVGDRNTQLMIRILSNKHK